MSLLRNSTLKQLRRINGEIIKQGGKTDRSSDTEQGYANKLWIDNPISGKRKVDTFNLTEIPDPTEQELKMKNEKVHFYDNDDLWFSCTDNEEDIQKYLDKYDGITFSVDGYRGQYTSLEDFHKNKKPSIVHKRDMEKMTVENMKKVNENGDNDSPIDIMKNMKTIRDWQGYTSKPRKERDILVAGKFIETDKVKGYINRIEGVDVYIETLDNKGIMKVNIKDILKGKKSDINDEIKGTPLNGPANFSHGIVPKEDKEFIGQKLDGKSTPVADNKISKKNNVEKVIKENFEVKKFSDFKKKK